NGKGRLASEPEIGRFDKIYAHCEVLVVGGGPAGRNAAQSAAQSGDRAILLDEQPLPNSEDFESLPANVRVLLRTTAFGLYDHNLVLAAQRRAAGGRLWQIRARQVVLATGAHERPLVFANNDRPGIMLAGAVRTYLNRYGVAPGTRAVVFTNNDTTAPLANALRSARIAVAAITDISQDEAVVDVDVTVVDMQHAVNAGMRWVEHIKRFTTIGTGSDQGKTSGINEVGLVGALTGQPIGGVGTTTYRPPYVPVSFALMAGRNRGDLFDPIRLTSIHPWHVAHGAVFENVGQWKRPWYFQIGRASCR